MSYKTLYRTYRPKSFQEVIGQDNIVTTLKNIIEQEKISHAYLFAGPRGTGKTSVAHIFAREVNKNALGESVYNQLDILEIDAASNNGVDEIRKIIDTSKYAPTEAQYKVYIIDEVHMLTKGAFNALLKTLEEPPKHIIFILATTEPHKIPITILSRVQRFNFKRIENKHIQEQLKNVLSKESIQYDEDALQFIAKLSNGGLRDALSIADQAAAFSNNIITFESISQVFGLISIDNQIKIFNLAFKNKTGELICLVNKFLDNGIDVERVSTSLIDILRDFIVYHSTKNQDLLETLSLDDINLLNINLEFAYEKMEILMKLLSDLRFSDLPKQSFELTILKLAKKSNNNFLDVKNNVVSEPKEQKKLEEKQQQVLEQQEEINIESNSQKIENDKLDTVSKKNLLDENQLHDISLDLEQSVLEKPTLENLANNSLEETKKINEIPKEEPFKEIYGKKIIDDKEIINMLVQSNKEKLTYFKGKWINLIDLQLNEKFGQFATMLYDAKMISASESFILIASEEQTIVEDINHYSTTTSFLEFTEKAFTTPLWIKAITREQFESAKKLWMEMRDNDSLPKPTIIFKATINKQKTKMEKFGESLFGDLLNNE